MQGASYEGVGFEGKICGVSILRAGEVRVLASPPNVMFTQFINMFCSGDGTGSQGSLP